MIYDQIAVVVVVSCGTHAHSMTLGLSFLPRRQVSSESTLLTPPYLFPNNKKLSCCFSFLWLLNRHANDGELGSIVFDLHSAQVQNSPRLYFAFKNFTPAV